MFWTCNTAEFRVCHLRGPDVGLLGQLRLYQYNVIFMLMLLMLREPKSNYSGIWLDGYSAPVCLLSLISKWSRAGCWRVGGCTLSQCFHLILLLFCRTGIICIWRRSLCQFELSLSFGREPGGTATHTKKRVSNATTHPESFQALGASLHIFPWRTKV